MLQPNEVRYGNWILVPTGKNKYEWDQVIEISHHRVVTNLYSQNNSMGLPWNDVVGITLDEQVLKLCQFEMLSKNYWGHKGFKGFHLHCEINFSLMQVYKAGSGDICEISFLHQLQNAYFVIAQEEIFINQNYKA